MGALLRRLEVNKMSESTIPATKYKVGEWVYTYLGRIDRPFFCEIKEIRFEERGVFFKTKEPIYWLHIPKQEWRFGCPEYSIARTQSDLNSRY